MLNLKSDYRSGTADCVVSSFDPSNFRFNAFGQPIPIMTTLLPANLQNLLQEIIVRSNQRAAIIRAILLSTTEGVPLARVYGSDQPLNEEVLGSIESVWSPAAKQFPVLGLEKLQQVTAIYDHGTIVHIYQAPLVSIKYYFH
jgi:hypothetical protein